MIGWFKKQMEKALDDGGMAEKKKAIQAKLDCASNSIRMLRHPNRRVEDVGSPIGEERRIGGNLVNPHPMPQV